MSSNVSLLPPTYATKDKQAHCTLQQAGPPDAKVTQRLEQLCKHALQYLLLAVATTRCRCLAALRPRGTGARSLCAGGNSAGGGRSGARA